MLFCFLVSENRRALWFKLVFQYVSSFQKYDLYKLFILRSDHNMSTVSPGIHKPGHSRNLWF